MARTRTRIRKRKSRKQIKEEAKLQINQPAPKAPPATIFWVLTPRGKCPVPLEGLSSIDIDRWVAGVKKTGNHTVQSICYWIRDFYEIFSDEYHEVREYIYQNYETLELRNVSSRRSNIQAAAK